MKKIIYFILISYMAAHSIVCSSTVDTYDSNKHVIHSDKKYVHPKIRTTYIKQQFQIYRIKNEESLAQITKDSNNQTKEGQEGKGKPNFEDHVYFLVKEEENPNKPDHFDIETILLNGTKGELAFEADYDLLLIKSVVDNSKLSGKKERNQHINEKLVPIKRNPTTENLYNVPRKVSETVSLIRSKRYVYQFSKKILTSSSNQIQIQDENGNHTFTFDKNEGI